MNGFFSDIGNQYILKDNYTKLPLYNYHFNNSYYMTVANNLFGESRSLEPTGYTFNNNFRYCFIKSNNKVYSVGNTCVEKDKKCNYTTIYNLHDTEILSNLGDVNVNIKAFVPRLQSGEIFSYTFTNNTNRKKVIEIAIIYSFESNGMGVRTKSFNDNQVIACESLPYHAKYDDYEDSKKYKYTAFSISSEKPSKICCSELSLFDGVEHIANNVFDCKNIEFASGEKSVASFIYKIELLPKQEHTISTYTSLAFNLQEVENSINKYFEILSDINNLFCETKKYFEEITKEKFNFSNDDNLNNFASFWAKKQVLCMAETRRRTKMYCVRNSLQDALGLSYIDELKAVNYFKDTICLQENNGWLRQHGIWGNIYPISGLGTMVMRDGPSWLLLCVSLYINDSKNYGFLDDVIPYKNGGEGTLFEHLRKAIDFMWQDRGMFGLSLLGDGDWTDPINGPGRKGKGVSTWTSMAFVFGMREYSKILKYKNLYEELEVVNSKIKEIENNICKYCYKDNQFIAGYNDDGIPYGSKNDQEGSMFLNMHSWAILSGVAKGDIKKRCVEIIKSLILPIGAILIRPSFTKWSEKFGRISLKSQGTTENGSAYCHASLFAVYALLLSGEKDDGLKLIKEILPTHNHQADYDTQVPIFIPNYYFGMEGTSKFGRSSAENITGSADWLLKIYNDFYINK